MSIKTYENYGLNRDQKVHLFKGANHVGFAGGQILYGSHHARRVRKEIETRVLTTVRQRHKTNLQIKRNAFALFNLEVAQLLGHRFGNDGRARSNHLAVQQDLDMAFARNSTSAARHHGRHTERCAQSGNV
jgi:hypothetical protein